MAFDFLFNWYLRAVEDKGRKNNFLVSYQSEFERERRTIEQVLSGTEYYHGTGAFQYRCNGESKYEGITGEPRYILESLFCNNCEAQRVFYFMRNNELIQYIHKPPYERRDYCKK